MPIKSKRHEMIVKIISSNDIETQEELAQALLEHGFPTTQATVSRDIKELRLLKVLTHEGKYRYSTVERTEADTQDRLNKIFSNCVISVASAGNLIVLKTIAGSAGAACEAVDSMKLPEIIGSIAGDNTVFLAVHESKIVPDVMKRFQKLLH